MSKLHFDSCPFDLISNRHTRTLLNLTNILLDMISFIKSVAYNADNGKNFQSYIARYLIELRRWTGWRFFRLPRR